VQSYTFQKIKWKAELLQHRPPSIFQSSEPRPKQADNTTRMSFKIYWTHGNWLMLGNELWQGNGIKMQFFSIISSYLTSVIKSITSAISSTAMCCMYWLSLWQKTRERDWVAMIAVPIWHICQSNFVQLTTPVLTTHNYQEKIQLKSTN